MNSYHLTIMALTLTISGNLSALKIDYLLPLELREQYVCGLVDMQTYNTIPSVDST